MPQMSSIYFVVVVCFNYLLPRSMSALAIFCLLHHVHILLYCIVPSLFVCHGRLTCFVLCFMMWYCLCLFCCICIMTIIVVCIFIVCIFVVGLLSLWTPSPHLLCCSILPSHLNHQQVQHPITSFFLSILTHFLQVAFSCPSKMFTYFL